MEEGIQEDSQNTIVSISEYKLAAEGMGQVLGRWCGRMMEVLIPGAIGWMTPLGRDSDPRHPDTPDKVGSSK